MLRAIKRQPVTQDEIEHYLKQPLIRKELLQSQIKVENIYAYICDKLSDQQIPALKKLCAVVLPAGRQTRWMERYFPNALDELPKQYRSVAFEALSRYLSPMDDDDIDAMKHFYDIRPPSGAVEELREYLLSLSFS